MGRRLSAPSNRERRRSGACAGTPRSKTARPMLPSSVKEDAMILVVFDPRTGERVTLVVAETAQGKRIVKTTRQTA